MKTVRALFQLLLGGTVALACSADFSDANQCQGFAKDLCARDAGCGVKVADSCVADLTNQCYQLPATVTHDTLKTCRDALSGAACNKSPAECTDVVQALASMGTGGTSAVGGSGGTAAGATGGSVNTGGATASSGCNTFVLERYCPTQGCTGTGPVSCGSTVCQAFASCKVTAAGVASCQCNPGYAAVTDCTSLIPGAGHCAQSPTINGSAPTCTDHLGGLVQGTCFCTDGRKLAVNCSMTTASCQSLCAGGM